MWHIPQSLLVVQITGGSLAHVPVVAPVGMTQVGVQVENPVFPHVDRAAQRVTLPLQFVGIVPSLAAAFIACATRGSFQCSSKSCSAPAGAVNRCISAS